MIVSWMAYAAAVGTLLGVAALAGDASLRAWGRPARGVWAIALLATIALPSLTWFAAPVPHPSAARIVPAIPASLSPERITETPESALFDRLAAIIPREVEAIVLAAWLLASAGLAVGALLARRRLDRCRSRWHPAGVDGRPVLVSRRAGPAVVGLRKPMIVVPRWLLEGNPARCRLAVLHEAEHVAARDPLLLAFGLIAVVLMPWSPPVWWQVRRLRRAIEIDCDDRVLRRGIDIRQYGALLVEVCSRPGLGLRASIALVHPPTMLERRIRAMTREPRIRPLPGIVLAVVSATALALACEARGPVEARRAPEPVVAGSPDRFVDSLPDGVYTLHPVLEEPIEVSPGEIRLPAFRAGEGSSPEAAGRYSLEKKGSTIQVRLLDPAEEAGFTANELRLRSLTESVEFYIDGRRVSGDDLRTFRLHPSRIETIEILRSGDGAPGQVRITTRPIDGL